MPSSPGSATGTPARPAGGSAPRKQVQKLLATPVDPSLRARLIQACQGNESLAARVEPFANLLRLDLRDRPLVFLWGAVYVTETGSRRDSGTAYTTKELADEVAEHTLAPALLLTGTPAHPRHEPVAHPLRSRHPRPLRSATLPSGREPILVAACRYLADRLIEAWRTEHDPRAAETATAADDPNRLDVVIDARRLVAEHCCYGVDRNPMATEMAKLSMWLTTVARNRPFTFLDHSLKTGDSLLGIWNLDQLRHLHYDTAAGRARKTPIPGFSAGGDAVRAVERLINEALGMRREMHSIETIRPADVEQKQKLHADSEKRLATLATIADVLAGAALSTAAEHDPTTALTARMEADAEVIVQLVARPRNTQRRLKPLSVPASVPGCASKPGGQTAPPHATRCTGRSRSQKSSTPETASMVSMPWSATPPFVGGQKITGTAGTDYRNHVLTWIGGGVKGFGRPRGVLLPQRHQNLARSLGYLATNTIAQGATSKVGLTQIVDTGWNIHRAISSTTWPGQATLEIAKVWATAQPWSGQHVLDGRPVAGIDEMLYPLSRSEWRKQRLAKNADKSFQGSIVLGMGFTMSPKEAQALINKHPRNADVLFPYLGGKDLNQSPTQMAPRWVINFFDWSEEKAHQYSDCFAIVEEKVKPDRAKLTKNAVGRRRAMYWWQYGSTAKKLYRAIEPLDRVLAISRVSKTIQPVFVPTGAGTL